VGGPNKKRTGRVFEFGANRRFFPEVKVGQQRKDQNKMYWSTLPFGKYAGNTLPEIIIRDPDWFFYMLPNLYGRLGDEAQNLARKARGIKIPKPRPGKWTVEYRYDCDQRFCGFAFVKADRAHSRWATRLPHLDLAWPLRRKKYDKRAGRIMIRAFRRLYFGKRKRLTKQRSDEFFTDDRNFLSP
jgi:hypothetical protein